MLYNSVGVSLIKEKFRTLTSVANSIKNIDITMVSYQLTRNSSSMNITYILKHPFETEMVIMLNELP